MPAFCPLLQHNSSSSSSSSSSGLALQLEEPLHRSQRRAYLLRSQRTQTKKGGAPEGAPPGAPPPKRGVRGASLGALPYGAKAKGGGPMGAPRMTSAHEAGDACRSLVGFVIAGGEEERPKAFSLVFYCLCLCLSVKPL